MTIRSCLFGLCLICVAAVATAQETLPAADPLAAAPPTDARHYSYAIGQQIGESFHKDQIELDLDSLIAGIKDALASAEPKYSDELCAVAIQRMYKAQVTAENKRNDDFLVANAKAEGVVTLPSGLQYKVLKEGKGSKPRATDTVHVNYVGTFIDGEKFDESGAEPASFQVEGVIPGWTQALQLMGVGSKWQLFVPSKLAYGESGGHGMPPHATLVFEVELLSID